MNLFKLGIIAIFLLFTNLSFAADTISRHECPYSNDVNLRYEVTATVDTDFTKNDVALLNEFITTTNLAAIICTEQNSDLITSQLNKLDQNFRFERRYYGTSLRILNQKASERLPTLFGSDISRAALIVVTIEPRPGDIRAVVIKDNKNFAMNVAGSEEEIDQVGSEEQIFRNTAKRELAEEIEIINIADDELEHIGHMEFLYDSPVINYSWITYRKIFTTHLDVAKTQIWLERMGIIMNDDDIISTKVDNPEVEWIFILKPEAFTNSADFMLPISDRTVNLAAHHTEMISVVLKGKFGKDVFVGRPVNYLNGQVAYNYIESKFLKATK
jgi:hypothetical protein